MIVGAADRDDIIARYTHVFLPYLPSTTKYRTNTIVYQVPIPSTPLLTYLRFILPPLCSICLLRVGPSADEKGKWELEMKDIPRG
jgi:hypothetical protein